MPDVQPAHSENQEEARPGRNRSTWLLRIGLEALLIAAGVFLALMGEQWRERAQQHELAEAALRRLACGCGGCSRCASNVQHGSSHSRLYAGATFTWMMAVVAHYAAGDGPQTWGVPLVLLALLIISYVTRPAGRRLAAVRAFA